jgi:hypothetical protein
MIFLFDVQAFHCQGTTFFARLRWQKMNNETMNKDRQKVVDVGA